MKINVRHDTKNIVKGLINRGLVPFNMEEYLIDEIMRENI